MAGKRTQHGLRRAEQAIDADSNPDAAPLDDDRRSRVSRLDSACAQPEREPEHLKRDRVALEHQAVSVCGPRHGAGRDAQRPPDGVERDGRLHARSLHEQGFE